MWIDEALSIFPLHEAPLNHEVARKATELELPHNDPADHLLAATAVVYDLTLDPHLHKVPWLSTRAE